MPTKPPRPCTRCGAKAVERGLCQRHLPTTTQRGYDNRHKQLRAYWAPSVALGIVRCAHANCGQLIQPDDEWDLDHHPSDRSRYLGPAHAICNRATTTRRPA